jgi:hypothetical protein
MLSKLRYSFVLFVFVSVAVACAHASCTRSSKEKGRMKLEDRPATHHNRTDACILSPPTTKHKKHYPQTNKNKQKCRRGLKLATRTQFATCFVDKNKQLWMHDGDGYNTIYIL